MKIDKMADVFLNLANFAQHTLLTLAPPSGYTLYPKAWLKVSKVSAAEHLSFHIKYCDLHLKETSERQTSFLPKNSPGSIHARVNKLLTHRELRLEDCKHIGYICMTTVVSSMFVIKHN